MQRILYVEDDLSLIDGLQYILETSGYTVDNARTIKKALELFKQKCLRFITAGCYTTRWNRFRYLQRGAY